ncbi:Putative ribonuclease H protein At1g65750 [Linum perenne]
MGGVRLIDLVNRDNLPEDTDAVVADLVKEDGLWDLDFISQYLPLNAIDCVSGMSPPRSERGEDGWRWGGEQSGKFSIRSAYKLILDIGELPIAESWDSIWKWRGPNRIRHFLWIAKHGRLLTNGERRRRHMANDSSCSLCNHPEENLTHVLRDCPFANDVWKSLDDSVLLAPTWSDPADTWLDFLLKDDRRVLFGVACWSLWKARNERVFSNTRTTAANLAFRIQSWTKSIADARTRENSLSVPAPTTTKPSYISWKPGPEDWITLNTDGAVNQASRRATAGGLLRNEAGYCLMAFSANLGICSITRAEMRGAIIGLKIVWDLGFRRVEVQLDSAIAISLLSEEGNVTHHHRSEVLDFRELKGRDWIISFRHTYREGNKAVDHLASRGFSLPIGLHLIPTTDCNLGFSFVMTVWVFPRSGTF